MKPMKLEFVVFNISQENATFLWKSINRVIEFLGFDTTGNVTELTGNFYDEHLGNVSKGGHAIIPGVPDTWKEDELTDDFLHYHYSNEDEHKD